MDVHHSFNNFDLAVIGVILLSGLLALMRGFTREFFSLIAWIGAYLAAVKFYPLAMPWMHHYVKTDQAAKYAAGAAVFCGTLILLMIVGSIVASFVKGRAATSIDRSLGFIYGLVRGFIVVVLVYLGASILMWPDIDKPEAQQQAAAPVVVQPIGPDAAADDKDHGLAPAWLLHSRTQPTLAFWADVFRAYVPQDFVDESISKAEASRQKAIRAARDHELERLSSPSTPAARGGQAVDVNQIGAGQQP